jgi:ATP-dependent Clp protease ATP-binding subunit ClpA
MVTRLSTDARKMVLTSAAEEARRRGDRRLGTDHLLLGLLHDPHSRVAQALGVDLDSARAAVGVNVAHPGTPPRAVFARRLLPLTSGAREVIKRTLEETRTARQSRIETRHFLLALLARECPDPAAELLRALGVDRSQVRNRLEESSE